MPNRVRGWVNVVLLAALLVAPIAGFVDLGVSLADGGDQKEVINSERYRALTSRAETEGVVRVIVGVKTPFSLDSSLSLPEAHTQRSAISKTQDYILSDLSGRGAQPAKVYKYKYIPYIAMTVDAKTLAALFSSSSVETIEEDGLMKAHAVTDWNMVMIGAPDLHTSGVTGSGISIAIIDTGVDKTHPYLSGAVVSEACYSTNAGGVIFSLCPGGVTDSTQSNSALPYVEGRCPATACDHGTHVAGIAAGRTGVVGSPGGGVAPQASIIAIKAFSRVDYHSFCYPDYSCVGAADTDILKGLEKVYDLRNDYTIASVNMSLGGGRFSTTASCDVQKTNKPFKAIIDTLRLAGIATVASSGNESRCGAITMPACISSAVSVGATSNTDAVAAYSNTASFLSLLAPGGMYIPGNPIIPPELGITSSIPGGTYDVYVGTSMAAPHVSGAWALLRQKYPSASVSDILSALTATGTPINDIGKCGKVTVRRINVDDAYNKSILAIKIEGKSKGTITGTDVTCPSASACYGAYSDGTSAVITAVPSTNSFLDRWTGCDTASGPVCNVTVNSITNVTATFNPPPRISAIPTSVNFGNIKVTAPFNEKVVTLKNNGTSRLDVAPAAIVGKEFTIVNDQCNKSLAKGETCSITVAPEPASATSFGAKTAQLRIASNDPARGTLNLNLKANVAPPRISVPAALSFPSVAPPGSFTKRVVVKNTGLSDLVIGIVSKTGDQFTIGPTNACDNATVLKGGLCTIDVTFAPAAKAAYTGTLSIPYNDPSKPAATVTLKGAGK